MSKQNSATPTPAWVNPEIMTQDEDTGKWVWKVRPASHFKSKADMNAWNLRNAGRTIPERVLKARRTNHSIRHFMEGYRADHRAKVQASADSARGGGGQ